MPLMMKVMCINLSIFVCEIAIVPVSSDTTSIFVCQIAIVSVNSYYFSKEYLDSLFANHWFKVPLVLLFSWLLTSLKFLLV